MSDFVWSAVQGFLYGVIGGVGCALVLWFAPSAKARRRRRHLARRSAWACNMAILHADRMAALRHSDDVIAYLDDRDPKSIEEWLADMEPPPHPLYEKSNE